MTKPRALVAARLSQMADGKTGIESSDAELIKWAEREGYEIVHVAADIAKGPSAPWDRKNLRPWLIEPRKIVLYDVLVAYRFDRLSRGDDESTSDIEAWARKNGKLLLTEDGLRYPCEGVDGIRWDVTKRIAHEEWLKTSERYTRMARFLRDGGYHVGRVPFGYRTVVAPGEVHKTLTPDPAEAAIVRDTCEWYLGGLSLDDICRKLNFAGRLPRRMKSGNQPYWVVSTLSKVLHNEVIAGRQNAGKGRTIKVEPIVSRDIWDAVIARLAARSKCKGRTGISQAKSPALLTSIIICTNDGKPMYRTGPAYYCRVKGCRSRILIDTADATVHEQMSTDHARDIVEVLVPGSGYDAEIAEVKRDMAEAVNAEDFERLADLRAELSRLRALPATATRVDRRESDKTVAQMWAAMPDDATRRAYLMERGAQVDYGRNEDGSAFLVSTFRQAKKA
jgi:DNA invertase Pin-like site-specific DNA recombinase